jgi:hypothetical protein
VSDFYYDISKFESRVEKEKKEEILKSLEYEVDPQKRNVLKDQLDSIQDKGTVPIKQQVMDAQPLRHKIIRDTLVHLKNKHEAKLHYLSLLQESEDYCKSIIGEENYKHFSEDYPEVQLILQQTEQEKLTKEDRDHKFENYNYDFGKVYQNEDKSQFIPFKQKTGTSFIQSDTAFNRNPSESNLKIKEKMVKKKQKAQKKEIQRKISLSYFNNKI